MEWGAVSARPAQEKTRASSAHALWSRTFNCDGCNLGSMNSDPWGPRWKRGLFQCSRQGRMQPEGGRSAGPDVLPGVSAWHRPFALLPREGRSWDWRAGAQTRTNRTLRTVSMKYIRPAARDSKKPMQRPHLANRNRAFSAVPDKPVRDDEAAFCGFRGFFRYPHSRAGR